MNAIFQLLNPTNTISVNRPLAHAVGLAEAVIYGALISKWHYYSERGMLDDGWFFSTAADLEESTAFTERQQKRCIDNLAALGLIKCEKRCMPAKRSFYIIEDTVRLAELISEGEAKMSEIKPQNSAKMQDKMQRREQKKEAENTREPASLPCSDKTSEQVPTKCRNKFPQNVDTCSNKTSEQLFIKSKDNNPKIINQSITRAREENSENEMIDRIDEIKRREEYLELLKENISYNYLCEQHKDDKNRIDELLSIMLEVICSPKPTVRVNGEDIQKDVVKNRLLTLNNAHIEYVLSALSKHNGKIHNIRAYLITALYNAPTTIANNRTAESSSGDTGNSSFDMDEVLEQIKMRYSGNK